MLYDVSIAIIVTADAPAEAPAGQNGRANASASRISAVTRSASSNSSRR